MPPDSPWPRASYASTSRPRSCNAVATATSSGLSLVAARPCTSTIEARGSPAADHERAASSIPSLVINTAVVFDEAMLWRSVLRAPTLSAAGDRDDRNVVIAQRLLEPNGRHADRHAYEHHST